MQLLMIYPTLARVSAWVAFFYARHVGLGPEKLPRIGFTEIRIIYCSNLLHRLGIPFSYPVYSGCPRGFDNRRRHYFAPKS
jgi:hypothetical protein